MTCICVHVYYVCSRIADVCSHTWSSRIPDSLTLLHLGSWDSDASALSTKPSCLQLMSFLYCESLRTDMLIWTLPKECRRDLRAGVGEGVQHGGSNETSDGPLSWEEAPWDGECDRSQSRRGCQPTRGRKADTWALEKQRAEHPTGSIASWTQCRNVVAPFLVTDKR